MIFRQTQLLAAPKITSFSPDSNIVGDGITNANVLTLNGAAVANSTVYMFDGSTLIGTTTANGSGAWNFVTATLLNGTHNFTARDGNAVGNTSIASAALNVTVDTHAPSAPNILSDAIGANNTVTLNGTAEASSTISVFAGSILLGTTKVARSGTWTFTTGQLSNGSYGFTATATDAAGNTSLASAPIDPVIGPVVPIAPKITSFSPDSNIVGDSITNANVLTLTGTAVANSTVNVFDGATLIGTTTANGSGAWNFATTTLSDGTHSFTATDSNTAGTSAASTALNVIVDTHAPAAPSILSDAIGANNTVTLNGTAEANSTISVFAGSNPLGTAKAAGSGTWTFTTGQLSNGSYGFTATATDAAGNTSLASAPIDPVIGPVVPIAPKITSFSPDSNIVGDSITNADVLTLTGTAVANSTVNVFDGATLIGTTTANGSGAWNFATTTLSDGTHSFTATDSNTAGTSAASTALNVIVDTHAPAAPSIVSDVIATNHSVTLNGTAEGNSTVAVYDGTTELGTAIASSGGAWSFLTNTLSNGTHSFTSTDTDVAGNISLASAALNVQVISNTVQNPIGVNLSGAEAAVYAGDNNFIYGQTYVYPTAQDLAYFHSNGINLIRLPIAWEAMEPTLNGVLNSAELGRLTTFLNAAAADGMHVIIDLHNFGAYYNQLLGSSAVPISAFAQFWTELATALKGNPAVAGYDIMNEPQNLGGPNVWPTAAQAAVNGIRSVDMNPTIYVEGEGSSNASTWLEYNANLRINDPANNLVYEAHQYFANSGYAGSIGTGPLGDYTQSGAYPTIGVDLIQPFVQWLQQNNYKGFMGEFGVTSADPQWLPVLDNFLQALQQDGISGTYWAGGPGAQNLAFSVDPVNGQEQPQLALLSQFASDPSTTTVTPAHHTYYGAAGNDVLTGYSQYDTLVGNGGNDVFVVENSGVQVSQTAGAGNTGIVQAYVNYTLPQNVNVNTLYLQGDATQGTANNQGDTLYANDTLASTLTGGLGNDTLIGGQHTSGGGHDTLIGGGGNDVFVVYNSADQVSQTAGAGNSGTVEAYVNYALPQNVNVNTLVLQGSATQGAANNQGDTLIANDTLASTLTGGLGNDTLVGGQHTSGGGHDTLIGGGGNDIFVVYNSADQVSQTAGASNSGTVVAYVNYDLPQNVNANTLVLHGSATQATANDQGDTLVANDTLASTLIGGLGNDILVGGSSGADTFVLAPHFDHDIITNFQPTGSSHDVIEFSTSVFANWSALQANIHDDVNGNAVITAPTGDSVTVVGVHTSSLQQSDFLFN